MKRLKKYDVHFQWEVATNLPEKEYFCFHIFGFFCIIFKNIACIVEMMAGSILAKS